MAEPYPTSVEELAKAIAIAEHGKDKVSSGEIPNNNPGNIKGFKTGKFINYPTLEKGWDALKDQASKFFSGSRYYNPEMTIKEIANKYVGTSDAPNWAKNVAIHLGITPDTKLKELMPQNTQNNSKINNQAIVDKVSNYISGAIKTSPQGNFGLPQDAQISPRQGLLEKARDMMYSSGPGRNLMDIVNKFNQVTGGPDLGNVAPNIAPGASHAITPFLEDMVKQGIVKKAANLFGEDRALFMDKMGDVYDLGHMYTSPNSMTHEEVLNQAGKLPFTYSEGKPVGMDLPQALANEGLTRVRKTGRYTGMEMSQMPSNAEMEQIMALAEKSPKMQYGLDLHNLQIPRDYMNPTFMENPKAYQGIQLNSPSEVIDSIYKFFGK